MIVERATPADARAVAEIQVTSWRVAYAGIVADEYLARLSVERRQANWLRIIDDGNPILLVARDDDLVLGWLSIGPCRDRDAPPARAEIWAIYVAPETWFRGVGTALWARSRELVRVAGFASCSLWVLQGNHSAQRFYRSSGFTAEPESQRSFMLGGQDLSEIRYVYRFAGAPSPARLLP